MPGLEGIGKPNARLWHVTQNFNVTYHFDEFGWRDVPDQPNPKATIVLLGCSTTFGWGVEDGEAWPALAAQGTWRDARVLNLSSPGWGPWQVSWILEDFLAERPKLAYDRTAPPVAILYCWFDFHLERVSNRDLAGADPKDVTLRLLWEMHERAAARGIPFAILRFSVATPVPVDPVLAEFAARGGTIIDLSAACPPELFPGDGHPTARWHRSIAEAIAREPALNAMDALRALGQPRAEPSGDP